VPLMGGILSDRDAYRYLPRSVGYLPPTGDLVAMLEASGFEGADARRLFPGVVQLLTATRGARF
jgi:demethylmenaquinone methyltransferase/2-methoxy-6-polyprenyl-1,4-benzoquinol methylase